MKKDVVLASATLLGTIIGAGVFAIPFAAAKSGFLPFILYFIILGPLVLILHLFFAEIVLKTKGSHCLPGYAQEYLGRKAKVLTSLATILGAIGALLVYIILGGAFLKIISPFTFSAFSWSLVFWVLLSFLVLLGIKSIASVEFWMNIGLFAVIFAVFALSAPKIQKAHFILFDFSYIFLPFGILLFSLIGWNAVPEIKKLLKQKDNVKKVILASFAIVLVFYFLFGLIISGATGPLTSQEAFVGLSGVLGSKIIILGGIFGLLAVATSFLVLANYLKNSLVFDHNFSRLPAFLIACFCPLILFFLGFREFIQIIGAVGIFVGLIEGTIICLVYKKMKKSAALDKKLKKYDNE